MQTCKIYIVENEEVMFQLLARPMQILRMRSLSTSKQFYEKNKTVRSTVGNEHDCVLEHCLLCSASDLASLSLRRSRLYLSAVGVENGKYSGARFGNK